MRKTFFGILVFISLGSLAAQSFVGKLNPFPVENKIYNSNGDTLRILAVMVEFQADKDNATFGNGKLGSIYSGENLTRKDILDPLPHNKSYFSDHLLFVKNYFRKVSKGNFNIEFTVMDSVITVSQAMRSYSPDRNSDDLSRLGNFAKEVWELTSQKFSGFNFGNYQMFAIFHAGVGRDVNLPGSIGNERDLPSVYLSKKALKKIFGNDFNGFPVNGGAFNISNSAILPSTESRELSVIGGTVLLQLSTNGLIAASVASHLGLPDLFDTETGTSAIGRFGLMDGQAIFTYGGAFPPEPSPWEKIYLGWESPVTLSVANSKVDLVSNLASAAGDTTILKIPLNQNEYFLLENRARDANNDGSTVTYKVGATVNVINFANDTTGYQSFDVDSLAGVITDVDEFDWAVPGSGIVIWHIDENIINEKLADNSINKDKFLRGVDVEEADGIQDIGEEFTSIFGDLVIGEGTDEDLWYSSNPAKLFKNVFDQNSKPNTNSNTGGASLISVSSFSDISNKMSFLVKFSSGSVNLITSKKLSIDQKVDKLTALSVGNKTSLFAVSNKQLNKLDIDGNLLNSFDDFTNYQPVTHFLANNEYAVGAVGTKLNVFRKTDQFNEVTSIDVEEEISAPPVISSISNTEFIIHLGTSNGNLISYTVNLTKSPDPDTTSKNVINAFPGEPVIQTASFNNGSFAAISENKFWNNLVYDNLFRDKLKRLGVVSGNTEKSKFIFLSENNMFYIVEGGKVINSFKAASDTAVNTFILADLDNSGNNYIVYPGGKSIYAYNLSGAISDNFPVADPQDIGFIGTPLSTDIDLDGKADIVCFTTDGRVVVISGSNGKYIEPFPLSAGSGLITTPILFPNVNQTVTGSEATALAVLTENNYLSVWNVGDKTGIWWSGEFGDSFNSSSVDKASDGNSIKEFFPKNRVYNWPNPVYSNETNIRYYVAEDSKVNIKIFDLAGDLVDELSDNGIGQFDNETVWNVSNIESGVYFARVEVTGSSGNTDSKIIKIAVVK